MISRNEFLKMGMALPLALHSLRPVSNTHLTLPPIYSE